MDAEFPVDDRLETLEHLLDVSKSAAGHARLTADGTLTVVLRRLSSCPAPLLLPCLRLVRNLCSDDPTNQDAFLASGGPDRVASVLVGGSQVTGDIILTVLQVLTAITAAGEAHRAAVWARFFPVWFREMARYGDVAVSKNLCVVLDMCCSSVGWRRRLGELCEVGRGLPILLNIVVTMSRVSLKEEYFYWLLGKACIEEIYFNLVFQGLSMANIMGISVGIGYTKEQAFLLETLSHCLSAWPTYLDSISNNFTFNIVQILEEAASVICVTSLNKSDVPIGSLATAVLEYSLLILRDICSWKHHRPPSAEDPADSLVSADIIELLLGFLRELEPVNYIKDQGIQASTDSFHCPYQGFRKDVVSVICCYLNGRKHVQDEIRKQNGIPLLLQQCILGDGSPFLRKWATLSIQYLLEGNLENQYKVAELELKEPVITPQIAQMGLILEIDVETQRPKMINILILSENRISDLQQHNDRKRCLLAFEREKLMDKDSRHC